MTFGPYPAVVIGWHDADTCKIDTDLGFGIHATGFSCRIFGINAPELKTTEGIRALATANELCPPGTRVKVLSHSWDKYGGRFDGELSLPDGSDYGQQMIDQGQAVRYIM